MESKYFHTLRDAQMKKGITWLIRFGLLFSLLSGNTQAATAMDTDGDGVADNIDACPADPGKLGPGINGCGVSDTDALLVGGWWPGYSSILPGEIFSLTFYPNGTYVLGQNGDSATPSLVGLEYGSYAIDPVTNKLTTTIIFDQNGEIGLSHPKGRMTIIAVDPDNFTLDIANGATFNLSRVVDATKPEVGSWWLGSNNPETGGIRNWTFYSNGTFIDCQNGDGANPSWVGIEYGNYSIDPVTKKITATVLYDQNGELGLSNPDGPAYFEVFGTQATLSDNSSSVMLQRTAPIFPDKIGVYRQGDWYLDINKNGIWEPDADFHSSFGTSNTKPLVGDWNGDGYTEIGAYLNGRWYLDLNGNGVWDDAPTDRLVTNYGVATDIPVVGDWNGDGIAKIGIYRPSSRTWYLDYNNNFKYNVVGDVSKVFGQAGDTPVVGDWTGSGTDKIGVYHNGQWYLDTNGNFTWDGSPTDTLFGSFGAGMLPVVGDWSGGGIDGIGTYRNGVWYLDIDGSGNWDPAIDKQMGPFGTTGMLPLVGKYFDPNAAIVHNPSIRSGSFIVSPISGNTSENGGAATFTVRLGSAPTANVTIPVSSSDLSEGKPNKSSLTFTNANWNGDQTVTVTGISDNLADGATTYSIVLGITTSTDTIYNALDPADVSVINTDIRSASFVISAISSSTSEMGTQATFKIHLGSQPTANVTIPVSSSDPTEGTINKSSLIFTSANWNVDQTVTVTGISDSLADGSITYQIVLGTTTSTDSLYKALDPADVTVTNTDVRSASLVTSAISGDTSESGTQATFQVRLGSQPTANVTIPVSSSDLTEGTVDKSSLTFTNANWNGDQTVTVTGVSDAEVDGAMNYNIVLGATSSDDSLYNNLNPAAVSITNIDVTPEPIASVSVSKTSVEVDESGASATFNVALGSRPTADVTIPVSSSDLTEATVNTNILTFTPSNWAENQTVTVTGVSDNIADGNQTLTIVLGTPTDSADTKYRALDPSDVGVTTIDLVSAYSVIPAISAGKSHNLLLANDGSVWGWGSCGSGQLDTTTACASSFALPQRLNISKASAISAGYSYSAILKNDGTVWTSGVNDYSQLGHASSAKLAPVDNLTDVKMIVAGTYHVLSVKNNGTVWAWGKGLAGQLGNGFDTNSATPVQSTGALAGKVITAVAAGVDYSLALDNGGKVYSWGTDYTGQLGISPADDSTLIPTAISSLSNVSAIGAGQEQSFAVGTVGVTPGTYAWGFNNDIQLGTSAGVTKQIPTVVKSPLPAGSPALIPRRIDGSDMHTVALGPSGSVYTWGDNEGQSADSTETSDNRGALGTGNQIDYPIPTLAFTAGSPGPAMDVNAGSNYTLVLFTDGRVQASGVNNSAQLGSNEIAIIGANNYSSTPVFVEDPGDTGPGSIRVFYAYRPILAGYPATSTTSTTATVAVCPNTLATPANCGPITHYKYSTDNGLNWSAATAISDRPAISLNSLQIGLVNLWVKGMSNDTTEIQTDSSAVKISWAVN